MSKKFDVVIGNPPYQGDLVGDKTSPPPIYHFFMDESVKVGQKVVLITPGRFLFNTGRTPKKWNRKMLSNENFKVVNYEPDSSNVFVNTKITGGIVISYQDLDAEFTPVGIFTAFEELNSILKKINSFDEHMIDSITYSQASYKYASKMHTDYPITLNILSEGNQTTVGTGDLKDLQDIVFYEKKPSDDNKYIEIAGLVHAKRVVYWINADYIIPAENFDKWKVLIPQANGSGALGEKESTVLIGKPQIAEPFVGHSQTFISIGAFDTKVKSQACMKYIKTKFARAMLGVLKVTQHNPPRTWSNVPLQDFTEESDIDWSKSIPEIDQQLYKKYNLNEDEIEFIETHIKEMS